MNMEQAHPQPTLFDGELKSYQLKVHATTMCKHKLISKGKLKMFQKIGFKNILVKLWNY